MPLPEQLTWTFEFRGDPVLSAQLQQREVLRCVLDTGAPYTVLRVPPHTFPELVLDKDGWCTIEQISVQGVAIGPLRACVRIAKALTEPELYLGTSELRSHCVVLDYHQQQIRMEQRAWTSRNKGAPMQWSRGRPTISLFLANHERVLVVDTGSNAHWLFHKEHNGALIREGFVSEFRDEAACGLGNITVQRALWLDQVSLANRVLSPFALLLAPEGSFGGPAATIEDGILGTGSLLAQHDGLIVLDFLSEQLFLA